MADIKHFEDLWNESEDISLKVHKEDSSQYLLEMMKVLIDNYRDLLTNEAIPKEVITTLKKRYMGEIVFLITAISARDDINVYASLMEEIKLNKL